MHYVVQERHKLAISWWLDKILVHTIYNIDVHESVYRDTTMKTTNKMYHTDQFIIPSRLSMFWVMFLPIIRSTWLYSQHLVVFTKLLPAAAAATWVNTTRYCEYSQVLLLMGENITRNMESWLGMMNWSVWCILLGVFIVVTIYNLCWC
jgi:hypothetical protein